MGLLAAYLFANWFLKTFEKVDGMWVLHTPWAETLMNFRRWILLLLLLLIPLGTAILCAKVARMDRDVPVLGPDGLWFAFLTTFGVLWLSFAVMGVAGGGPPRHLKQSNL